LTTKSITYHFPEVYRLELETSPTHKVKNAKIIHGFSYRPVERILAGGNKSVHEAVYIVERICGLCSHAHATAFCQAVEGCFGLTPPPAARSVRTLIAELERVVDHLLNLGEVVHVLKLDNLFQSLWEFRKKVTRLCEDLTGKRVHFGINCIGGVTWAPSAKKTDETLAAVEPMKNQSIYLGEMFVAQVQPLLKNRGIFKAEPGQIAGTGPNLRAFGDRRDVRLTQPYAAYGSLKINEFLADAGDAWARVWVRLGELPQSFDILQQVLDHFRSGDLVDRPSHSRLMKSEATSSVEAPRGEDKHSVKVSPAGTVLDLAITVPTLRIIPYLEQSLAGADSRDVDAIVASFDLCLACKDST
jgi:membrane-bound hydrogenase subunit alpha